MMRKHTRSGKILICTVLFSFLYGTVAPPALLALTSGPAQPDFTSFEPVATTNMVNEFTGAFTYNLPVLNVPGPNGSGYPLSLSYHSGSSAEEEASWVGYGWTLNPGSIIRNKRGLPDEYNGAEIKYWNKVPSNWTVTASYMEGFEIFSKWGLDFNLSDTRTIRYNNYRGFGTSRSLGLSAKGVADIGMHSTDGDVSFSFSVNPVRLLSLLSKNNQASKEGVEAAEEQVEATGDGTEKSNLELLIDRALNHYAGKMLSEFDRGINKYINYSFSDGSMPTTITPYKGESYNFSLGLQGDPFPLQAGDNQRISGSYSIQTNISLTTLPGYGYMYSGNAGSNGVMDYYTEKDAPYNRRDNYLGIPFSNADNFMVTGEGLSGGFRLYHRKSGHFRPANQKSTTTLLRAGADVHIGSDIGIGANIGIGHHTLESRGWDDKHQNDAYRFATANDMDEPYFFRFNNDLGGSVEFADDDDAIRARIDKELHNLDYEYSPVVPSEHVGSTMNQGRRSGRSSYIGYSTNDEMNAVSNAGCSDLDWGGIFYRSFTKDQSTRNQVKRTEAIKHGVGEFAVTKGDGSRYVYGLPVYSRNEKNYRFGLDGLAPHLIKYNYLAHRSRVANVDNDDLTLVGEEMNQPYATAHLLTEITTPDYIDRTNNGPTPDDLGGYTKFTYERVAGTDHKVEGDGSSWYKWRSPYNGMLFHRNSVSDPRDDMGVVSFGEKEIYYLNTIETRTHIAQFVVADDRRDAFEAVADESVATDDSTATTATSTGSTNSKQKRLERIELYARDENGQKGKLINTVHFAYDYSLCKNLPNSRPTGVGSAREGKLTLRRVWFEYDGTVNAKISPYVFSYTYPTATEYGSTLNGMAISGTVYDTIAHFADQWAHVDSIYENPPYSPYNIDRWGYYRFDGRESHTRSRPWNVLNPVSQFDPAAWQLKRIQLPSGGEIHIQYEQNEYRYVQHDSVMSMLKLRNPGGDTLSWDVSFENRRYFIDVSSMGLPNYTATANDWPEELHRLRRTMEERFVTGSDPERIYFKFLYGLNARPPGIGDCGSEYISGYARVESVGLDDHDGLYVRLGSSLNNESTPLSVCNDFIEKNRLGIIGLGSQCRPSDGAVSNLGQDVARMVDQLLGYFVQSFVTYSFTPRQLGYSDSYIRIPIIGAKKGGGIRVKRILMFDKGIESGDASLYGSEYIYRNEDGSSSGVATNEPAEGREENVLVQYLGKRTDQSFFSKIIAGENRIEFEGPIGESLLPAPSVGYSRVVVRNIHKGKTGTGYVVNEFHTAKDYPFDLTRATALRDGSLGTAVTDMGRENQNGYAVTPGYQYGISNMFRTQGYRFILNNMHGQPKRVATYVDGADGPTTVMDQVFEYFQPGETVPLMYGPSYATDIVQGHPGKEMEVVFETRSIEDITSDGDIQFDGTLALILIPIPLVGAFPSVEYGENIIRTHVTTKVVRYPAIQKSSTITKDGTTTKTEYIAFDPATGTPALIKTTDGYNSLVLGSASSGHNGEYYSYTEPAHRQYASMGQKAMTERGWINSSADLTAEKLYFNGEHHVNFKFRKPGISTSTLAMFSSGDLVRIEHQGRYLGLYHIGRIGGSRIELLPPYKECSFVNTDAVLSGVNITIIRSGRTNQLNVQTGSTTTYGGPPEVHRYPVN